ncbi:6,7-dimethyl-8-ribityllumazine synthase [Candidatus Micrarchaeota archaeon]|nr:6,7-dimethyl-8-ribityllumazine synthase [Candidatus Micrarchaeota archaeon]
MNEFERVGLAVKQNAQKPVRVAIVRSLFRDDLTQAMEALVRTRAPELNAEITETFLARGVLETPFLARHAFQDEAVDAVVVLGVVIRGETDHDRVVVEHATRALVELSLKSGKPVGVGIIGPGVSLGGAEKRVTEYATGALDAVVCSWNSVHGR